MRYLSTALRTAKSYVSTKIDEPSKVGTAWRLAAGTLCAAGLAGQVKWISTLDCWFIPIPDFLLPYAMPNIYIACGSSVAAFSVNVLAAFILGAGIQQTYVKQRRANIAITRNHMKRDALQR